MALETGADAIALLRELGAPARLIRHHELVLEAATKLTDGLARELGVRGETRHDPRHASRHRSRCRSTLQYPDTAAVSLLGLGAERRTSGRVGFHHGLLGVGVDAGEVHIGAALHDVGKIARPEEMTAGGDSHEALGRRLLLDRGVPEHLARFCVTHGAWRTPTLALEDLLVALADKLWKGKRVAELEALVLDRLANRAGAPRWRVFELSDALYERIADGGLERLGRS